MIDLTSLLHKNRQTATNHGLPKHINSILLLDHYCHARVNNLLHGAANQCESINGLLHGAADQCMCDKTFLHDAADHCRYEKTFLHSAADQCGCDKTFLHGAAILYTWHNKK